MSQIRIAIEDKLAVNRFKTDRQSHIQVDLERCKLCEAKSCVLVCPAGVYELVDNVIKCNFENCLECGACSVACSSEGKGAITWKLPRGGFGVSWRYG